MARWVGLQKSYVINGVGHEKILCLLTRWVGGSKKGLKHAYVIFEWSLTWFTIWLQITNIFLCSRITNRSANAQYLF